MDKSQPPGRQIPPLPLRGDSVPAIRVSRARLESIPPPGDLWSGRIRPGPAVGSGATGHVLKGSDTKLGRELALKVARWSRHDMPRDLLARFVEEAQITAQLEHPNVVPVHDLGVDPEGRPYFSMKLIRGQSLESILDKRRAGDPQVLAEFGLRRLLDVFLQVCQAIGYAHARGVIHRDLKPANIMVGDFGEVLVMDWGIAKVKGRPQVPPLDSEPDGRFPAMTPVPEEPLAGRVRSVRAGVKKWQTQHGAVVGTPAYMSPEQALGADVDERSDLYSLGVILYEIICGDVPFNDEDAERTLTCLVTEEPRRPSAINPDVPLALETIAMLLLEKKPERRTLSLAQIREHVHNYIEGIGRDYRPGSLWSSALWVLGALLLFAFLVWYLTGRSVVSVLALGPPAVVNAVGWFFLVLALGYPLWAAYPALREGRSRHAGFRPPTSGEVFVSGYLAHRTFATTLAPVFELVFLIELGVVAIAHLSGSVSSQSFMYRISQELRAGWAQGLAVILVFFFGYLLSLSDEVRYARRIERYHYLVRRPAWESTWPFFLMLVLLLTVATADILDWTLASNRPTLLEFVTTQVLSVPLNLFEIIKTLVFQGTFLLGLVVATMLLSFPFAELVASLRLPHQPADEAFVAERAQYFLRSIAAAFVARSIWLYGGAMIGCLTAMTVLSEGDGQPLTTKVLYILGPAGIGFLGFSITGRYVRRFLNHAPAVRHMLTAEIERISTEQRLANLEQLGTTSLRLRLLQLPVPILCLLGYLLWSGTGVHREAIRELIMPVTTRGWLLILPYVLMLPVLLLRDSVHLSRLKRWRDGAVGRTSAPPPLAGAAGGTSTPPPSRQSA